MPGRVILSFERPAEKIGAIYISQRSQRRPELGRLVDLGAPLNETEEQLHQQIEERAKAGHKFPVSYAAGIGYWQQEYENFGEEYAWLKDLRVFRIDELATSIVDE
jgi:hypothetical protein